MIIFDLDGTLWDTVKATEKASIDVAKDNKINDFDVTSVRRGMGLSRKENMSNYYPGYDEKDCDLFLTQVNVKTVQNINAGLVSLYDGVKETIKELAKNYKLAIVTNNNDNYVKTFFTISGLEEYFSNYMGASTYGITKGEAIKRVCDQEQEKFNIYVGDIEKDMLAAKEADIEFIHAKYGFGNNFEYKYFINNFSELNSVITSVK